MASLNKQANGRRVIQFRGLDGKRRSIRLGKIDEGPASDIKAHVEHLARCQAYSTPRSEATDKWLAGLLADPEWHWLYDRVASAGLVQDRPESTKRKNRRGHLEPFLDSFITKRMDVKPSTKLLYHQTKQNLIDYFGTEKPIPEITAGDAKDWRLWLLSEAHAQKDGGLAKSTANRRVKCARQFMEDAVDHEIIPANPFRKVKGGQSVNRERLYYVSWEMIDKVIEAATNAEWRAIIALARFGGLRIPSELYPLRWEDVNFAESKLLVTSPKTQHVDKPYRMLPDAVFGDVRPYLEDLFKVAKSRGKVKPSDYVIPRHGKERANLRTQFERFIKRAGLEPWPKLFQNCRSSRETELIYLGYQIHEVCAWIGNSPQVANDHYLQVLDSNQRADLERCKKRCKNRCSSGAQGSAMERTNGVGNAKKPKKNAVSLGFATVSQHAQEDSNLRPTD